MEQIINDFQLYTPIWVLVSAFAIYYVLYYTRIGCMIVNFLKGIIDSL